MKQTVKEWVEQEQGKHFCQCGCGGEIKIIPRHHCKCNGIPKVIQGHKTEESKRIVSKIHKGKTMSEEAKRKISKANSGENNYFYGKTHTKESKKKMSREGMKHSKETKIKISKSLIGKNIGFKHSEETKKKMSEIKMKQYVGEGNPNWQGGSSIEYCYKFNEKCKESNRDKFNRQCFLCGIHEDKCETKLDVHHVDYNKEQGCNSDWKLVSLCHSCHSKTSSKFNRDYWEWLLSTMLYVREMIFEYNSKIDYRSLL